MKIIVSKTIANNYDNFIVVDSLKKAAELKGVEILIINNFVDNDFDAGVYISRLKEAGVGKFIYISNNPITTIRMLISGTNGFYFEDEFYFDSEEDLSQLLEELNEQEDTSETDEFTTIASPALNIITDFMKGFVNGDKLVSTPFYLERVNESINVISNLVGEQQKQILAMGDSAISVFEKASKIIKSMDEQRKLIEKKLEDLEYSTSNAVSSKPAFPNSIFYFPPYNYMGNSKVCLFREYSPCRYLTSFVLGYYGHLHIERNKRCKLVFVVQKGAGVSLKYNDICVSISEESANMSSLYGEPIIVTNSPKKLVMKDLLKNGNDVIIIVDRLYNKDDIVVGRIAGKVNAVGGYGDVSAYNIRAKDTIFPVTKQPEQLFHIPVIKDFPKEPDAREAVYNQALHDRYNILDKYFGI